METTNLNKQNMGWGILLICFGISALLGTYTQLPEWAPLPVFALGGLIVLALFLTDRSDWVVLIPAYIMLAVTVIAGAAIWRWLDGDLMGTFVLAVIALPFFVVYFRDKQHWWALIPAFILGAIAVLLLLTSLNVLTDQLMGPFVLFAIAVPFLFVYYTNRQHWWALIPAYVMIVIGLMVWLIEVDMLRDLVIAAYINLAIALPFFVVYFRNRQHWWALIPGGILTLVGLGFLVSEPVGRFIFPVVMIGAGLYVLLRQTNKQLP